mmetsp:Transcript_67635/g.159366  ORF Transcript_67635/g.159366 Transcript_67635/m.159366 type:complete len:212 (-) Transcript_67635:18-653(-)
MIPEFKNKLQEFARKHRTQINKDPEFRKHFAEMCTTLGVDPLSSNKGFFAETLGVGDFYYELGVQVVQVCLATRSANGGLCDLDDVVDGLRKIRGRGGAAISYDDVERAVKALRKLGQGFDVIALGRRKVVQSVPVELSTDHTSVLRLAEAKSFVTASQVETENGWIPARVKSVLDFLVSEGFVWVDDQGEERQYWFPALVSSLTRDEVIE